MEVDLDKTTNDFAEQDWTQELPTPPTYLGVMRFVAAIEILIGVIALFMFVPMIFLAITSNFGQRGNEWLLPAIFAIQGFVAYGVLSALADIAENMVLTGWYVKKLHSSDKKK